MATVAHHLPITMVEHYTDSYFRLRVERPKSFASTVVNSS